MSNITTTDKFTMAHNTLNMVDMLLVEAGFQQDSSIRYNLKIAKSMFREAETQRNASSIRWASKAENADDIFRDAVRWRAFMAERTPQARKEMEQHVDRLAVSELINRKKSA